MWVFAASRSSCSCLSDSKPTHGNLARIALFHALLHRGHHDVVLSYGDVRARRQRVERVLFVRIRRPGSECAGARGAGEFPRSDLDLDLGLGIGLDLGLEREIIALRRHARVTGLLDASATKADAPAPPRTRADQVSGGHCGDAGCGDGDDDAGYVSRPVCDVAAGDESEEYSAVVAGAAGGGEDGEGYVVVWVVS